MNERNPYSNLKYVFSTGNQIDSLRIRGSVSTYTMGIDPKKNDPSSILVLIHRQQDSIAHPDSLIMMKKPGYYTYEDRKSVEWGKSVSVRVDLGGRRIIKKKIKKKYTK